MARAVCSRPRRSSRINLGAVSPPVVPFAQPERTIINSAPGDGPPVAGVVRGGSYSSISAVSTNFEAPDPPVHAHRIGRQLAGDADHQNMCFSIPRCAMILLPISSMDVCVVLSEGMFSRRKMRSATASSWVQRSSLA